VGVFGEVKEVMGRTVHDDFGGGLMGELWNVLQVLKKAYNPTENS
jgi:hypothetical protein